MARLGSRGKLALIVYLILIHLLAFLFILGQVNHRKDVAIAGICGTKPDSAVNAAGTSNTGKPLDSPSYTASQKIADQAGVNIPAGSYENSGAESDRLLIPVAGVKRGDLQDTYTQSRSGGRAHNAIDIMAAEGTPVLAVADGIIAKFFDSRLGGITIYQWSADEKRIYYYAHLQRRKEGITEGMNVRRGTVIGFVGNTGDAGPGNYHLHFSISLPTSPGRYWGGTDINPFPILKQGIEPGIMRE